MLCLALQNTPSPWITRRRGNDEMLLARTFAHWLVCSVGLACFAVAATAFCLVVLATVLADRIWPGAGMGNCWTYAMPRWWRSGGYIAIRRADRVALCKWLPVPHALHIERLPRHGVKLSQFVPVKRKQPKVCPAVVGYYAGEVRNVESPHDAATQE